MFIGIILPLQLHPQTQSVLSVLIAEPVAEYAVPILYQFVALQYSWHASYTLQKQGIYPNAKAPPAQSGPKDHIVPSDLIPFVVIEDPDPISHQFVKLQFSCIGELRISPDRPIDPQNGVPQPQSVPSVLSACTEKEEANLDFFQFVLDVIS